MIEKTTLIAIREARPDDIGQMAGLLESCAGATCRPTLQDVICRMGDRRSRCIVADDTDRIMGFAVLQDRRYRPWSDIDFLGVSPRYRGRGLEVLLTRRLRAETRRPIIRLSIGISDLGSSRLYKRCGFSELMRRKAGRSGSEDKIIMVACKLEIPAPVSARAI